MKKIKTGITGLDEIIKEGINKGSTILVEGSPGVGKTTFGFQFLVSGIEKYQENGLYISFEETATQMLSNMESFNFHLKEHSEKENLIVMNVPPDTLMASLLEPESVFEKIINKYKIKRVVIDSLIQFAEQDMKTQRDLFFTFKNSLMKHEITALLLSESSEKEANYSFKHFVSDGVIRLQYKTDKANHKKRIIEITKLRGGNFQEGEHIYKFDRNGINIIPSNRILKDPHLLTLPAISTGLEKLDTSLSLNGGITKSSMWLLEVDSKSNYQLLISSIIAKRIHAGENFLWAQSAASDVKELKWYLTKHGLDLEKLLLEGRITILEQYNRPISDIYKDGIINVSTIENGQFLSFIKNDLYQRIETSEREWFLLYDINAAILKRGKEYILKVYPEIIAMQRALGVTALSIFNTEDAELSIQAMLERASNGIIKMWTEDYQFLKVMKSPNGHISDPYILVYQEEAPYIRLV